MMPQARRITLIMMFALIIALLAACGGAPAATAPIATPAASTATAASVPTAIPAPTNAAVATTMPAMPLVGTWQRVNSCKSFVQAFEKAGLIDLAPDWLAGGGYFSSPDQIDKTDLCKGATEVKHAHFF